MRRDAVENRERLLDAAVRVVRRDGPGVPMSALAAAAGVGVGTLYRHFGDRDELLDALSRHAFGLVLALARDCDRPDRSGADCLAAYYLGTIAHADRLVLPLHGGPARLSPPTVAVQRQVRRAVQAIVDRGIADGSLRADLTAWDVVAFGAMIADPLPNSRDWAKTARRIAAIHLDGQRAR